MTGRAYPPEDALGTIYLIHFSARTSQERQHYLGWSSDIEKRFAQHRSGHGSRETRKAVAEGLRLTLAQTWTGTPLLERRIKAWSRRGRKGFSGICPLCPGEEALTPDIVRGLGAPTLRIRYQSNVRPIAGASDNAGGLPRTGVGVETRV